MKTKVISAICFLSGFFFTFNLSAQTIYKVTDPAQADIKVYLVDTLALPDLAVCYVQDTTDVKGNKGLWKEVSNPADAEFKVYFTFNPEEADLTALVVNNKQAAGWVNQEKKKLLQK